MSVVWPILLTDARVMLRNFLHGVDVERIDRSDNMIGGFHDSLRTVGPEPDRKITAVARIPISFPVKLDFFCWLWAYEGTGMKILLVKAEATSSRFARMELLETLTASISAQPVMDSRPSSH